MSMIIESYYKRRNCWSFYDREISLFCLNTRSKEKADWDFPFNIFWNEIAPIWQKFKV